MERKSILKNEKTQKVVERPKTHYRKEGGGSFHMPNRIIKPGQTFWAYPEEIPEAFRDTVVAIGGNPPPIKEQKLEVEADTYQKVHKGGGKYIVIRTSDEKVMNEGYLNKVEADNLINTLQG